MTAQESLREISKLRLRFQMNNRLRLESLAALSKIFREHGEDLKDEVLSSLVFALPSELPGERAGESDSEYETGGTILDVEARGAGHPPAGPGHHPPPRPGQPPPGPGQPPPGPGQPPPGPGQPPPGPGQPPPGPGQPPPGPGQPPPGPGQPPPGKPRGEKGWTVSRGSKKSAGRAQKAKAS
jgi:hypothetical protein